MNKQLEAERKACRKAEMQLIEAQAELSAFHEKAAKGKAANLNSSNTEFVENLIRQGRLMPRDRNLFVHALNFSEMPEMSIEFSEYDNPQSFADELRERLAFYLK